MPKDLIETKMEKHVNVSKVALAMVKVAVEDGVRNMGKINAQTPPQ
jgi:hypothetical protein